MRQHGHQHMHAPMHGRAQNGAQLREEHVRLGQAPANGAQAQGGIGMGMRIAGAVVQRLVGTHVYRANRQRQAAHALHGAAVGLVLLFFVRQMLAAPHEQKFAAKQPHAHGACV